MHRAPLLPPAGDPAGLGQRRSRPQGRSLAGVLVDVGVGVVAVLTLTGCGSDAGAAPTREYTLHVQAVENGDTYGYVATDPIDLRVGDRVTFEMVNDGALIHDLQVVHPDGQPVGTAAAVGPGGTISVTVDLVDAGFYRLNCLVDNHLTEHDMQAIVEVTEADGTPAN